MASRSRALSSDVDPQRRVPAPILLLVGASLLFLTFMRFSLAELGWIAFAPFLVFLHRRGSLRAHAALLGALVLAFLAAVSKIRTAEIPWAPVPMFAIPIALSYFVALSLAGVAHRRLGARWGIYAFACGVVALSWVQYSFTEGGSWGVLAHTQLDNLPLVQLAAVTGLGGLTFLVAMPSALAAAAWSSGWRTVRADAVVFLLLLGGALVYGQIRLGRPAPSHSLRMAGIVTPVTHREFHAAVADIGTLRAYDQALFDRTGQAADLGAKVVVWPEVATLVGPADEAALVSRGRDLAMERGVLLVMAYGVVESMTPFHFANKYRIYLPDGQLADEYVKRHPVPGDPNDKGVAHARVVSFDGVRFSGGICYDYDFPAIARDNASEGAQVALLPSSDWKGIDPLHAQMAMLNALSVGLPIVRPVRAATSIAADAYGRVLASVRADDPGGDGVMLATVPTERVATLYARTGEVVPLAALVFCALLLARLLVPAIGPFGRGRRSARAVDPGGAAAADGTEAENHSP